MNSSHSGKAFRESKPPECTARLHGRCAVNVASILDDSNMNMSTD
jgi:hypothetical protein